MTDPTPTPQTPTRDEAVREPYATIIKRLLNPPFGTDTSERLLMGTAADAIRTLLDTAPATASGRVDAVLNLYREAVRIDVKMEGPQFMGANSSALKRAWEADRASLSPAATPVSEAGPDGWQWRMWNGPAEQMSDWMEGRRQFSEAIAKSLRYEERPLYALAKPASSPAGVREASLSRSDVCRLWQYAAIERPSMTVEGFTNLLLNEIDDRAESLSQSTSAGRVGE